MNFMSVGCALGLLLRAKQRQRGGGARAQGGESREDVDLALVNEHLPEVTDVGHLLAHVQRAVDQRLVQVAQRVVHLPDHPANPQRTPFAGRCRRALSAKKAHRNLTVRNLEASPESRHSPVVLGPVLKERLRELLGVLQRGHRRSHAQHTRVAGHLRVTRNGMGKEEKQQRETGCAPARGSPWPRPRRARC